MRLCKNVLFAALILLITPGIVKAAEGDSISLTLDQGFVNRPVELAVFGGDVTIAWDEGALVAPTTLEIRHLSGNMAQFVFGDATAIAGSNVYVTLRAEGNAFEVTRNGAVDGVTAAAQTDGLLTGSIIASADLVVVPVTSDDVEEIVVEEVVEVATNVTTEAPVATDETMYLMLDLGFVGRPVSLEVFDGELTVAWDEKALIAPTSLRLTRTRGGVGGDQEEAAKGVAIEFGDTNAISGEGTFFVSHKAHRPPLTSEHPEANVFGANSGMVQATFVGDSISYTYPASAGVTFAPVFRDGIMRSGIASWYAYKDCLCAASPDVPKGTRMKVSRQDDPSVFTVVTINDWGPERDVHPDRVIDLDKVAFSRIGNPRGGVLAVTVDVLSEDDPLYALGDELPPPPWRW
jgi:hypothetical protein